MTDILPWHSDMWTQLQARRQADRLPHALLLMGGAGLGKQAFARLLAGSLLCEQIAADGGACGACRGCRLLAAGTHPDFVQVSKDADATQIKVDQIRALIGFMNLSRQFAPQKVALLADAESMNRNAANSLLKTLEEPPGSALLILVSSRAQTLPATISSRCQGLRFSAPPRDEADAWLRGRLPEADTGLLLTLAQGRPLAALSLAASGEAELREQIFVGLTDLFDDHIEAPALAARWQDADSESLMRWLVSWLQDIARVHFGGASEQLDNPDYGKHLHTLAKRLDLAAVFALLEETLQVRRLATTTTVNRQLLLEDLMLGWRQRIR